MNNGWSNPIFGLASSVVILAISSGQIGSLALNGVGNILVVDRQAREVREFTAQGEYVRTIGSPGQGPGQFERGVTDIFLTKGDTLLVPDVRNRRVHRFAPDGSLLDAVSLDIGKYRVLRSRWSAVRAEGVMQVRPAASESEDQPNDELRVVNSDGSLGAVLLSLPRGGLFEPGGALRYFTPEPMWGVTDSLTVMYGVTGEYRLGLYDRGGALRTVIAREHMPRPITDRDIRAFFAYLDRAWLANGARPGPAEGQPTEGSLCRDLSSVFSGPTRGLRVRFGFSEFRLQATFLTSE